MQAHLSQGLDAVLNEYDILEVLLDLGIVPKSPNGTLIGALDEPVLDIGCGRHANLVEHLNCSGLRAEGIDPELLDELAARSYLKHLRFAQLHNSA